jgi:acetone carboxylase gamma subunit
MGTIGGRVGVSQPAFARLCNFTAWRASRVAVGACDGSFGAACYNCRMRECPLCEESMRLSEREVQERNGTTRLVREWICPECDYFEEAEVEG